MQKNYQAIVIGTSAGGFQATKKILAGLSAELPVAIIIVQHLSNQPNDSMVKLLDEVSALPVKEAEDKESILAGVVYLCPPDYHLLIDMDKSFALSAEPKVNYSRPSIDVLFESAAEVYQHELIGIVLTGANADGSCGLKAVKEFGGLAIIQDAEDAEFSEMPTAALAAVVADEVLPLGKIAEKLKSLTLTSGELYG